MNIATVGKLCGRKFGTYVLFLDKHSIQSQNGLKQLNDLCVEHLKNEMLTFHNTWTFFKSFVYSQVFDKL